MLSLLIIPNTTLKHYRILFIQHSYALETYALICVALILIIGIIDFFMIFYNRKTKSIKYQNRSKAIFNTIILTLLASFCIFSLMSSDDFDPNGHYNQANRCQDVINIQRKIPREKLRIHSDQRILDGYGRSGHSYIKTYSNEKAQKKLIKRQKNSVKDAEQDHLTGIPLINHDFPCLQTNRQIRDYLLGVTNV